MSGPKLVGRLSKVRSRAKRSLYAKEVNEVLPPKKGAIEVLEGEVDYLLQTTGLTPNDLVRVYKAREDYREKVEESEKLRVPSWKLWMYKLIDRLAFWRARASS